jgi:hypothetical protein
MATDGVEFRRCTPDAEEEAKRRMRKSRPRGLLEEDEEEDAE